MAAGEETEVDRSSLFGLADELIEIIFSNKLLDYKDLCRCSEVCSRFYAISRSPELWRKKALQRWVFWKHIPRGNWLECFRHRIEMENHMLRLLHKLTNNYYTKAEVSKNEFQELEYLVEKKDGVLDYAKDTLLQFLQSDPRSFVGTFFMFMWKVQKIFDDSEIMAASMQATLIGLTKSLTETNLTYRYYAGKVMAHLKCHQLRRQWQKFLLLPTNDQHLEAGATLITKWINYNQEIDEVEIGHELGKIADLVRRSYAEGHASKETTNSDDTEPVDSLKMLETIRKVVFVDLQFIGNSDDYYSIENSLIDKVLKRKTGNPITLSVVFTAIARRLGVMIEPVNFPNHFLLRWRSNQDPQANDDFTYIDCFNGARFMSQDLCLDILMSPHTRILPPATLFPVASPTEVFSRIMANIVNSYRTSEAMDSGLSGLQNALELLLFLKPDDAENQFLQARIFVHLGINLEEAITRLEALKISGGPIRPRLLTSLLEYAKEKQSRQTSEEAHLKPKLRSDQAANAAVAYKVGMVMRHRRYHYGCVIYGWDPVCKMDDGWIQQMGVDSLTNGRHQPFYNVLGDDDSCRYASQESLQEEPGQDFNPHPELGKHFKAFTGTRYIPNKSLQERYPEDLEDRT